MTTNSKKPSSLFQVSSLLLLSLLVLACAKSQNFVEARGDDDGDSEDFNDAGFDDGGYSQPHNHDAEGSHHSPQSSAEDDIDDDDDVDETHVNPVTSTGQMTGASFDPSIYGQQQAFNYNPGQSYNQFAAAGAAPDAYAYGTVPSQQHQYQPQQQQQHHQRYRRSLSASSIYDYLVASATSTSTKLAPASRSTNGDQRPLKRVRRHSKYIGPVYTYVKTDKHANFKWGVKHKVGKKHYG